MQHGVFGNITDYIDLPQAAFWIFFLFFLGLVYHNRRWGQAGGLPDEGVAFSSEPSLGFPEPPTEPETYILNEGGTTTAPHFYDPGPTSAEPLYQFAARRFRRSAIRCCPGSGPAPGCRSATPPC